MSITKKLVLSGAWLVGFVALSQLLGAMHLSTSSEATASSVAGNTFLLLIISVLAFAPILMAILVWFGRPHWLYGKKQSK